MKSSVLLVKILDGACFSLSGGIVFHSAVFSSLIHPLWPASQRKEEVTSDTNLIKDISKDNSEKPVTNGSAAASERRSHLRTSLRDKIHKLSWCTYKVYVLDVVYCAGFWFMYGGHLVLLTFTPIRGSYLGFTKHQGAWLVSICGIASGTLR